MSSDAKFAVGMVSIALFAIGILVYHFAIRPSAAEYLREHCIVLAFFEPQPDITAYETALVLAKVGSNKPVCIDAAHPMPDLVKRHFREEKP